jgi:Zn-dependent protease
MTEAVQKLNFPEALTTAVMTAIGDKAIGTTVDFVNEIAGHMAEMIVYGLGFLILILLLLIAFGILALVAKVVSKLPLIKELNHGGGLLIGAAVGLISVYFVLAMLTFFQTFSFAREAVSLVEQSTFAIYFYNHNLLQYVFNAVLIEGTLKL